MVKYRAYPTIPIVFVSSVHSDRIPLHNTIGLAVTDLKEQTYVETKIEIKKGQGLDFFVQGERIEQEKLFDLKKVVDYFFEKTGKKGKIVVVSENHNIFSGSSDAGAAAFIMGMNRLLKTDLCLDRLADLSMKISESSIRSLYGGMNELNVDGYPKIFGKILASSKELKSIRIFAIGFNYQTRITAQEIFQVCRQNPFYEQRLKMIPVWIAKIKLGLIKKDWDLVFAAAEQNCNNAHQLLEYRNVFARRKEMLNACYDVIEMRKQGLKVYWTAGGGNVINIFTWGKDVRKVLKILKQKKYPFKEYKVADMPKEIKN